MPESMTAVLAKLRAIMDAIGPAPMPIRPSAFIARGMFYEMDFEDIFAAPVLIGPGGKWIYPKRRVLLCNVEDYNEAMARVKASPDA